MLAKTILIPSDLKPADVAGRAVVVFDVLRATTTMTAALAAGVSEIRVFDSLQAAREAAEKGDPSRILCGELNCLPPPGFDLGNSPRDWNTASHAGRHVFMATTNGTRAIAAAAPLEPGRLLVGAIVNAQTVARAAVEIGNDLTLLCAGTNGQVSLEDLLGAGAVLSEWLKISAGEIQGDAAQIALRLFEGSRDDLPRVMRLGAGGKNLLNAGLEADIDFCARVNSLAVMGVVDAKTLIVKSVMGLPVEG